jgi:hypothetical protein
LNPLVSLDQPPCGVSELAFLTSLTALNITMRRSLGLWMMLSAACLAGCGGRDSISVTGVLQKGGEKYNPPEGHKLALYFYPIAVDTSGKPAGDVEMADYDPKDGSFTVPGAEGYGIRPGRYRIAVVETLRREEFDKLKQGSKPKKAGQTRLDKEMNLLEASFGEKTSPFVRDLKTSTKLTLDMAKPSE